MDKSETVVIFIASVILGLYGAWGERLTTGLLTNFGVSTKWIPNTWPIIDVIVVTIGCILLIRLYKKLRVGCYPSTFIYCFNLPEKCNPSGKSHVVGYCQIKPEMANGEIAAVGASFFWENGHLGQRAGFTSTLVRGSQEDDETTCHIQFDINVDDLKKRHYRHGVLQFQLVKNPDSSADRDAYAGYLKSYTKEVELQDLGVSAKGYAEWYKKGCVAERDLRPVLEQSGNVLFAKLNAVLGATPSPTLWKAKDGVSYEKANIWRHEVPTPQSVILNERLRPFIERYLTKVLGLFGLDYLAIRRFQSLAAQKAEMEQDDTLVAYERELKAGLIGLVIRREEDKALTQRAEIIYGEIKGFFTGDSLLDIGCGNGLISSLAKAHFKRIQLLDVVEYVPKALNLPFAPYTEGHPLPIGESFDTVLLLTVLHHSANPVELLKLAWGATKQRLIIIESVVGIHDAKLPVNYELVELSEEDQIAYAAFVDWFYNRVLHDDVPVPYNFTTVENWQSTFLQHNMHLMQTVHLGQDIEIGPEYHVLFVLEKEGSDRTLRSNLPTLVHHLASSSLQSRGSSYFG